MFNRSVRFIAIALVLLAPKAFANTIFYEDFADNSAGWTLGPQWEIGPAADSNNCGVGLSSNSDDPAFDNTPTSDNGVAGVVIGGCTGTMQHGFYFLTSAGIDTTGSSSLTFDYYRWLVSDYTPYMENLVQVFDGFGWNTLWNSGTSPGVQDTSWQYQSFDITSFSNNNLQVRFGFNIGSSGVWTSPSWNVDDVCIYSGSNAACAPSVPEPSLPVLLTLGLVMAGIRRNKMLKA